MLDTQNPLEVMDHSKLHETCFITIYEPGTLGLGASDSTIELTMLRVANYKYIFPGVVNNFPKAVCV